MNELFRAARERQGLSRRELADAVNVVRHGDPERAARAAFDANHVGKIETGRVRYPDNELRRALRSVLKVNSDEELGFRPHRRSRNGGSTSAGGSRGPAESSTPISQLAAELRRRQMFTPAEPAGSAGVNLVQLRNAVGEAHLAYQRAEYANLVRLLPDLVHRADGAARHDAEQHRALGILGAAHLAVSKLALKLGDPGLAWVAADRALRSAEQAGADNLAAAAVYSVACALLASPGHVADAADAATEGLTRISEQSSPAALSVSGSLTLLLALVAARRGRAKIALGHLGDAAVLADRLGKDRNYFWTGFGPTNVLIHRVTTAVNVRQFSTAVELGERTDTSTLPPSLVSRRAQVHLDLAAAFTTQPGGDPSALLHLLAAERTAPQIFQVHDQTRTLVTTMLARERRAATPGLRALAVRARIDAN
ncbi:helix-turn-helix domain-containing protein [Solwaraspora sp. WMMB335]|uniref:helix-turn-helix domain-containing protein n=1 Tax=Solwaraspora sp. WMMB335 TaxID=3404118 RepID=UPI003B9284F0